MYTNNQTFYHYLHKNSNYDSYILGFTQLKPFISLVKNKGNPKVCLHIYQKPRVYLSITDSQPVQRNQITTYPSIFLFLSLYIQTNSKVHKGNESFKSIRELKRH